jgi:hypothetical protein
MKPSRVAGAFLMVGFGAAVLPAEAGTPSVENVAPAVGQRGTEFKLRLVGAGLADAADLLLYSPGVAFLKMEAPSDNEVTACLRAAADCPLGTHPFRLRTKRGLSELRVFRVTPLPVILEEEPNGALNEAQAVPQNVTVTGVIEAGDVDGFQVTLRRGERLAAEVEAIRLGGTMLDTVLTVFGPDGKKIVTIDDTPLFHQDPFVTIVAPEDGRYVVQVRETSFDGDENSRYALHLGTFPRPAYVYPAGGKAGETMTVRFGGDAAGEFRQEIPLPDAPGEPGLFPIQNGLAAPTPNPFRVSPFANVLEAGAGEPAEANAGTPAELPAAFNGIVKRPGEVDSFSFRAAAGALWQFEVFAARIGAPIDSLISIVDPSGNLLVANDDDSTHDSRLVFAAPHTGEYRLTITDKRGEGGENFVYRVEATQPRPRLAAFLPRPNRLSQERQAIAVSRGNRATALIATQRTGFEGPVALTTSGLPDGVSFSDTTVPPDLFAVPVVFEARADAPLAGALAEVRTAGASGNGTPTGRFLQVVDLIAGTADSLFTSVEVDRLAIAVVDESPISVSIDEPRTTLAQDGTISLQVRVERRDGFEGPIDVTLPFLPPWIDGPEKIALAEGESTAVYIIHAFPQAEPRTWGLCAEAGPASTSAREAVLAAQAGAPPRRRKARGFSSTSLTPVSSRLITLCVSASPVTGTFGTVVTEQGKDLTVVCELDARGPLPPQMTAELEGLPNRVAAAPVTISSDDRKVSFAVRIEPTAPVGSFPDLACRLAGAIEEQEVSYCVGRGGVLRIEPAGALVTDEIGRPLSRLEILRKSRKQSEAAKKGNHESRELPRTIEKESATDGHR